MGNEITVRIKCDINDFCEILKNKGFKDVDRFSLDDTYFVPTDIDINKTLPREILKNCVLIRNIIQYVPKERKRLKMTYKKKEILENGEIVSQENINVGINSFEDGGKFLSAIGYKKLMNIKENDIVYEKNGLEIATKDIENGENLAETNEKYDNIEKLKQMIIDLDLPIDKNDFFVKKAEIELKKILGDY